MEASSTKPTTRQAPGRSRALLAGFFILLLNSSYLAGSSDPTMLYFGNVALHMLLGLAVLILFTTYLWRSVALGAGSRSSEDFLNRGGHGGPPLQAPHEVGGTLPAET